MSLIRLKIEKREKTTNLWRYFIGDKEYLKYGVHGGEKLSRKRIENVENKGLFEFIARQVIGSYQPGFFPFPIFPRLVKFDSPDILPAGIKRKPPRWRYVAC